MQVKTKGERMKKWQRITVIVAGSTISCVIVYFIVVVSLNLLLYHVIYDGMPSQKELSKLLEDFDREKEPWEKCLIKLTEDDIKLEFLQRRIHPYLVEYDYGVRIKQGSSYVTKWLWESPGGRTDVSIYRYEKDEDLGTVLNFRGNNGNVYLRLDNLKAYSKSFRSQGRFYVREILDYNYRAGLPVYGYDKVDITETQIITGNAVLLGQIDGRTRRLKFIAADTKKQ
jgi:hypothetical protein